MFDIEEDTCGPYDNVEFPIRPTPAASGTWPRANPTVNNVAASSISSSSSSSSSASSPTSTSGGGTKLFGNNSLRATGPRLAPLMEVDNNVIDIISDRNHQQQQQQQRNTLAPFPTTQSSLSSSSSISTNHQQSSASMNNNRTFQSNQINVNKAASDKPTALSSSSSTTTTDAVNTKTTSSTPASTPVVSPATSTAASSSSSSSTQLSRTIVTAATNDSSTYVPTQVTSMNDTMKRKTVTLNKVSVEDEDFKRHDLNPGSRLALERVYINHPDFYQLNSKILDEGSLLKQDVNDIYRKSGETLTYEQLLQGMMVDGERFLLGGCWLYFSYVQFLDTEGTRILREPYRKGRVGLTSKRALFLSTETFTDAALDPYGDPAKPASGGFKLEVSKQSNVLFKNIPLTHFHSAEMEVITGTSAQTKITKDSWCCGCIGRPGRWLSTPPMTRSINSRILRVGVSMPPWQTRMFMDIHLDPAMSLTTARDFISQLHQFAPHMN